MKKFRFSVDREASVFMQIAQFCNHLVANHSDPNAKEFQPSVVTYLSGDNLHEKQRNQNQNNFSFTGILDAIPVRHDQIASFYAKFKANCNSAANANNSSSNSNGSSTAGINNGLNSKK